MKFCKVSLFLVLLVAACLPAVGEIKLWVDIPFNFVALGKSLPAGHYIVWRQSDSDTTWYLSDNHNTMIMSTRLVDSNQRAHRPSLLFRRAGGAYSLIQIWDGESGRDVPQWNVKQTLVTKDESKRDEYVEIAAE
jgi:hypothetical protein